jgi:hypothetical protein
MGAQQLVNVLQSCACLVLLLILLLRLWPVYRLDVFRQRMFSVRDDLFAYAAAGNISFQNPAYRLLRQSMNGFLRYGHNLTLYRLLVTVIQWNIAGRPSANWSKAWTSALEDIADPRVRKELQQFHVRAMELVSERVILGSPVLWVGLPLCVIAMLAHSQWQGLKQIVAGSAGKMLRHIVDPRLLEEEAARLAVA